MKKVLVIAKDQDGANQCEKLLPSLDIKKVYPGVKKFPTHFQAVIVWHNEESDIDECTEERTRYVNAPIRVLFGKETHSQAYSLGLSAFEHAKPQDLLDYLNYQYNDLEGIMKKVFQSFDKDKSGYIDLNELKAVSKELGRELDQAELEECIKDLDTNKDGKISYDEFQIWWLSGRQAFSQWMKKMLNLQLQTFRIIGQISDPIKDILHEQDASIAEIAKNSMSINFNKVEHAGITIYAKGFFLSPEQRDEYKRIKFLHKFEYLPDVLTKVMASVQFEIKDGKVEEAEGKVREFIDKYCGPIAHLTSLVVEGDKLCLGITLPQLSSYMGGDFLEPYQDIITRVQDDLKVDQNIEIALRLSTSFKDLLSNDAEPIIKELLRGIALDFKLNLWTKISDVLTKLADQSEALNELTPILGGIAPAFLLRIGGKIDIDADDYAQEKIMENMLVQMLLMVNGQEFISNYSKCEDDAGFDEFMAEKYPFNDLVKLIEEYLGNEIEFSFAHPQIGFRGRVSGEGLPLIFRNIAKFVA